jgi:hypothetical protein
MGIGETASLEVLIPFLPSHTSGLLIRHILAYPGDLPVL